MLTKREVEFAISGMEPNDGFSVEPAVVGNEHSLHLVFRAGGEIVQPPWLSEGARPTAMIWRREDLTDAGYGDKSRLLHAVSALCRFVNTGGNLAEIEHALVVLKALGGGMQVEASMVGFNLINTEVNTEGEYEHIFAKPDCPLAVRWVENQFLDVVTLASVWDELVEARKESEIHVDFTGKDGFDAGRSGDETGDAPVTDSQGPSVAEDDTD